MKAQVTKKRVNLYKSFFVNYVRANVGNSLRYSICLIDIFGTEKGGVTFGLKYTLIQTTVFPTFSLYERCHL